MPQSKIIKPIKLSPSKLNLFLECPLCFWLENQGIHRPSGAFPSLPGGMDRKIKDYFDKYRAKGLLPPELGGKVRGKLFNNFQVLNEWRDNKRGLRWIDENGDILMGAIDDCLVDGENFIIIDFKTYGGSEIADEKIEYYQNQLNVYALLLEKNGFKHPGFAYLIFFLPQEVREHGVVKFDIIVKKVSVHPGDALKVFKNAIRVLRGKRPQKHSECEYCAWADDNWKFE